MQDFFGQFMKLDEVALVMKHDSPLSPSTSIKEEPGNKFDESPEVVQRNKGDIE